MHSVPFPDVTTTKYVHSESCFNLEIVSCVIADILMHHLVYLVLSTNTSLMLFLPPGYIVRGKVLFSVHTGKGTPSPSNLHPIILPLLQVSQVRMGYLLPPTPSMARSGWAVTQSVQDGLPPTCQHPSAPHPLCVQAQTEGLLWPGQDGVPPHPQSGQDGVQQSKHWLLCGRYAFCNFLVCN